MLTFVFVDVYKRQEQNCSWSSTYYSARKKVQTDFWAEAVNTVVYVLNRTSTSSVKDFTPYELWHGHKPVSYTHLDVYKRQPQNFALIL